MSHSDANYELTQRKGQYGKRTIAKGESLEEILEIIEKKEGRR